MTWPQEYSLFGCGTLLSAMQASLPILVVLFMLGVMRTHAWIAAFAGLASTFVLALGGYHIPVMIALSAAGEGAAFGLFPISWIVFWAICMFRITQETGRFEVIKDSIGKLTPDPRLQTLLIAFAFGAFLEGAAGFGAPVAIASTMLAGLGISPFDASALCLIANTAPVAFGSIGIPIVTLALTTGLPVEKLSASAGILCAPVALILPAYLVASRWGFRHVSDIWLPVLLSGSVFAGVQLVVSNFVSVQLTDIAASLASMGALVLALRLRGRPANDGTETPRLSTGESTSAQESGDHEAKTHSARELINAWAPYGVLVICILLWSWPPVHRALESFTVTFPWPHLDNLVLRMPPIVTSPSPYRAVFNLNWLAASGTSCMFACLLSAACFKMSPLRFGHLLLSVARQLILPTITVGSVLAMAFLMNYSGATATLGLAFTATGALFPFFSALLGWVGVFLTGSDTSSNALFGNLQVITAAKLNLDPVVIAATSSVGGVMGKMISLQTIAVAAAATGMCVGDQALLFRFTLRHSLLLVCLVGIWAMFVIYCRI